MAITARAEVSALQGSCTEVSCVCSGFIHLFGFGWLVDWLVGFVFPRSTPLNIYWHQDQAHVSVKANLFIFFLIRKIKGKPGQCSVFKCWFSPS